MKLLLIGCGRLGQLFLEQWAQNSEIKEIWVVQPSLSARSSFSKYSQIHFAKSVCHLPENFSPQVVVIAIKPQQIPHTLRDYQIYQKHSIFISLAAGVLIHTLKQYLGEEARIVRLMPNIAIKVQASSNLVFIPEEVSSLGRKLLEIICEQSGPIMWLSEEKRLDQLTVISGSGPAYFFLLMEALVSAAVKEFNVEEKEALMLVRQTFIGSALFMQTPESPDPEKLRRQVMSKGGVTEAAVETLSEPLFLLMEEAVKRGYDRVKQLQ